MKPWTKLALLVLTVPCIVCFGISFYLSLGLALLELAIVVFLQRIDPKLAMLDETHTVLSFGIIASPIVIPNVCIFMLDWKLGAISILLQVILFLIYILAFVIYPKAFFENLNK